MPIVTFTTDFGAHDGYVGALKGVVLSIAPQATLVDIAHGVPARDVAAGAVALAQAPPLHRRDGVIEGEVIHVDGFGNLITSLPAEVVERAGSDATVEVEAGAGHFEPQLGRTFSDVETGALIAYIGSGGQLEIARRN